MVWLIAVEGIDGSGKGTQSHRLANALQTEGFKVSTISFPRYSATRFGQKIGAFLNGAYGQLDQVHPTLVSLLFAGDRLESRADLLNLCATNDIVICDRYVASNIAHQGAKAEGDAREELRTWIEFVEFQLHQMPRPHQTFWLDVPVDLAQVWIARKRPRDYTDAVADLQEADAHYLNQVRDCYAGLAEQDADWTRIDVVHQGQPRTEAEITQQMVAEIRLRMQSETPVQRLA